MCCVFGSWGVCTLRDWSKRNLEFLVLSDMDSKLPQKWLWHICTDTSYINDLLLADLSESKLLRFSQSNILPPKMSLRSLQLKSCPDTVHTWGKNV